MCHEWNQTVSGPRGVWPHTLSRHKVLRVSLGSAVYISFRFVARDTRVVYGPEFAGPHSSAQGRSRVPLSHHVHTFVSTQLSVSHEAPRWGSAGSHGYSMFSIRRNCQSAFRGRRPVAGVWRLLHHLHLQQLRVSHPCKHLSLSVFPTLEAEAMPHPASDRLP